MNLSEKLDAYSKNNSYATLCQTVYKKLRTIPNTVKINWLAHDDFQAGEWLKETDAVLIAASKGCLNPKDRLMALEIACQVRLGIPKQSCAYYKPRVAATKRYAQQRIDRAPTVATERKLDDFEHRVVTHVQEEFMTTLEHNTVDLLLACKQTGNRQHSHAVFELMTQLSILLLNSYKGRYEFTSHRFIGESDHASLEASVRDAHNWVILSADRVLIDCNVHKRAEHVDEGFHTAEPKLAAALRAWEPVARAFAPLYCEHADGALSTHAHPYLFFVTHTVRGNFTGQPLVTRGGGVLTTKSRESAHQLVGKRLAEYHARLKQAWGVTDPDILACSFRCNCVRDDRMSARKRTLTEGLRGTIATNEMIEWAVSKQLAEENHTSAFAVDTAYTAAHKKPKS
jgi:hypothetical protein